MELLGFAPQCWSVPLSSVDAAARLLCGPVNLLGIKYRWLLSSSLSSSPEVKWGPPVHPNEQGSP